MDRNSDKHFDRMTELLGLKKQLLSDMLTLTEAQTPVIKEGSLDKLQKLIEEKQRRIDEIDKLDAEFGDCFKKLKTAVGVGKIDDIDTSVFPRAKQLKQATAEVLELVGKISSIEKSNSTKSRELLGRLGSQIKSVNQAKKINNAYSNPSASGTSSFFVDKKK